MDMEVITLLPELETTYTFELSTGSEFVDITQAEGSIGDLTGYGRWRLGNLSQTYRYGYWPAMFNSSYHDFLFSVSEACPKGAVLPFTATISDEYGNEWTESFAVSVEQ